MRREADESLRRGPCTDSCSHRCTPYHSHNARTHTPTHARCRFLYRCRCAPGGTPQHVYTQTQHRHLDPLWVGMYVGVGGVLVPDTRYRTRDMTRAGIASNSATNAPCSLHAHAGGSRIRCLCERMREERTEGGRERERARERVTHVLVRAQTLLLGAWT